MRLLLAVVLAVLAFPSGAVALPQAGFSFMMTGSNANQINSADAGLGLYLFDNYNARLNGNEDGDHTQGPFGPRRPSLKYESYAHFADQVDGGLVLPAVVKTVTYDPENWDLTPDAEKADLPLYARLFVDKARAAGFEEVGLAPSRDILLHNEPGTWCSRYGGGASNLDDAYLNKCRVPARMAEAGADFFQMQSQIHTTNPTNFKDFLSAGCAQARAVDPVQVCWGGLSTNYGNASQMTAAFKSAYPSVVSGYYYTVTSNAISKAVSHFRSVRSAGY